MAGDSYRQIARAAEKEFGADALPSGWDSRYACKDVRRTLEQEREQANDRAANLRRLELDRLDALQAAGWVKAMQGDPQAIYAVLAIMDRRHRLLRLDEAEARSDEADVRSNFARVMRDLKAIRDDPETPEVEAAWDVSDGFHDSLDDIPDSQLPDHHSDTSSANGSD